MDANGLRFWMLAREADWVTGPDADYDRTSGRLRLRSRRDRPFPLDLNGDGAEAEARIALDKIPQARDRFGARAYWDEDRGAIVADSDLPGTVLVWERPGGDPPDDFAMGHDGVLYVAAGGSVVLHDVRGRWADREVTAQGLDAWRLAPDPAGGAWVLARSGDALGHVHGLPFPDRPYAPFDACTARPCVENPDEPRLERLRGATWDGEAVALASSPQGRLAVLTWRPDESARIQVQDDSGRLGRTVVLRGVRFPHALAWQSTTHVAVRSSRVQREVLVYDLEDVIAAPANAPFVLGAGTDGLDPVGEVYPLRQPLGGGFVHTVSGTAHYPTTDGSAPLLPLSGRAYPRQAEATGVALDSGDAQTVWHRLYLEALVPRQTSLRIRLAATNERRPPDESSEWFEHRVGAPTGRSDAIATSEIAPLPAQERSVPRAAWNGVPSELPFHGGMLGCEPIPDRRGLFTVLIQRAGRRVRSLTGRFLWVRVELEGNGRSTPEIAALRAYGSRFSYVERYLPALYHESTFGSERDDAVGPAESTPADFLERWLGNPEGVLTLLEDRIGSAHLLTRAATVPEPSLEWLASWIGLSYDPAVPRAQRRELLKAAPRLFKRRGTVSALETALGLATSGRFVDGRVEGGAVQDGGIVVVENFRLRRTFATILGADLADEHDPLLAGLAVSGNSIVGDTLLLGDEHREEFLSLFGADLPVSSSEASAIRTFFDELAHRVTVLVHDTLDDEALEVIRRVVDLEKPAHVESLVLRARYPFLVAMASLIGIDTYLRDTPPSRPVRADVSSLGDDFLIGAPSFDGRLGSRPTRLLGSAVPAAARPTAVLRAPATVPPGASFGLDGSDSFAADPKVLTRFSWLRLQ